MFRKSLIAMMVVIMGITGSVLSGVAIGADLSSNLGNTGSSADGVYQGEMILDSEDYVVIGKMRFRVTSNTFIKNGMGMDISLEKLPVPCEAIVKYYGNYGKDYIALSIQEVTEPM